MGGGGKGEYNDPLQPKEKTCFRAFRKKKERGMVASKVGSCPFNQKSIMKTGWR